MGKDTTGFLWDGNIWVILGTAAIDWLFFLVMSLIVLLLCINSNFLLYGEHCGQYIVGSLDYVIFL